MPKPTVAVAFCGIMEWPVNLAGSSIPFEAVGGRIKGTLGDIDPLNKVPLKRSRSRVQKGYPLRGLPNTTPKAGDQAGFYGRHSQRTAHPAGSTNPGFGSNCHIIVIIIIIIIIVIITYIIIAIIIVIIKYYCCYYYYCYY